MKQKKNSSPTTPTPAIPTITAEQLAALTHLTPRRLNQLAQDNKIPPPINGQFTTRATISALFDYYQRDGEEIQKERLLKLTAERKMVEHRLAIEEDRLMPVKDAETQYYAAWVFILDRLQRAENELPPALAGLPAIEIFHHLHRFTEKLRADAKEKFERKAA